jgi:hypothetical protein
MTGHPLLREVSQEATLGRSGTLFSIFSPMVANGLIYQMIKVSMFLDLLLMTGSKSGKKQVFLIPSSAAC